MAKKKSNPPSKRKTKSPSPEKMSAADKRLARQVENAPAVLTVEFMHEVEEMSEKDGINRRIGLAALTRSMKQLMDGLKDDRDTAIALAGSAICVRAYAKRLVDLTKWMETAALRMDMAICIRSDMNDIRREAELETTSVVAS